MAAAVTRGARGFFFLQSENLANETSVVIDPEHFRSNLRSLLSTVFPDFRFQHSGWKIFSHSQCHGKKSSLNVIMRSQDQCSSFKSSLFQAPPNSSITGKFQHALSVASDIHTGTSHSVGEGDEFAQDGENSKGDANI